MIEHWIVGVLLFTIFTDVYLRACKSDKEQKKSPQYVVNIFTALLALPLKIIVFTVSGLLFVLIGPFIYIYRLIKK